MAEEKDVALWMNAKPFAMTADDIIKAMEYCARNYELYRIRFNNLRDALNNKISKLAVKIPDSIVEEE